MYIGNNSNKSEVQNLERVFERKHHCQVFMVWILLILLIVPWHNILASSSVDVGGGAPGGGGAQDPGRAAATPGRRTSAPGRRACAASSWSAARARSSTVASEPTSSGEAGNPCSASSMAGASTSARRSRPKRAWSVHHPSTQPGTVTASMPDPDGRTYSVTRESDDRWCWSESFDHPWTSQGLCFADGHIVSGWAANNATAKTRGDYIEFRLAK